MHGCPGLRWPEWPESLLPSCKSKEYTASICVQWKFDKIQVRLSASHAKKHKKLLMEHMLASASCVLGFAKVPDHY